MTAPVAVVLAAGKSRRMRSELPKVLHEIYGRAMVEYVLDAARAAGAQRLVVVVGHAAETVRQRLGRHDDVEFALQAEQLGTGHAVMMCREALAGHDGPVLVLAGDTPLLTAESLHALLERRREAAASCVIGTAQTEANQGLGRIVRDPDGEFVKIVEEKDATDAERKITEINVGCYAFDCQPLLAALERIRPENQQAEYYLTDCPAILKRDGRQVVAACVFNVAEAMGVNTRAQLAAVRQTLRRQKAEELMSAGVSILDPEQTDVDPRARIEPGAVIHPFTSISGAAAIGANCQIGPHAAVIGPAALAVGTVVGPFEIVR